MKQVAVLRLALPLVLASLVGTWLWWNNRAQPRQTQASLALLVWIDQTLGSVDISKCRAATTQDDPTGQMAANKDVVLETTTGKPFFISRLIVDSQITTSPFWHKFEEGLKAIGANAADLDHRSCGVWNKAIALHTAKKRR